tara:strand:+ start:1205 stop:2218 length:1014 start_codon:yes stop_codon:yes gene_type:complete
MTNELKEIIDYVSHYSNQNKFVLATVVHLVGSSYRRPGVRMLINNNGESFGNVSGGCVEKEVIRQSQSVFESEIPKIIKYDGRFRLGCEGIITILIEPFSLSKNFITEFNTSIERRFSIYSSSTYKLEQVEDLNLGTQIQIGEKKFSFHKNFSTKSHKKNLYFKQSFAPIFRLFIFGAEHDAVQLCKSASLLGWEITIVAPPDENKSINFFRGAKNFITPIIESFNSNSIDKQSAIILMTHSFNKDIQYLIALKETFPAYFGLLGPSKRREKIIEKFLDHYPECSIEFLDQLRGPAGLDIGAESPSEISISILSEILSVIRHKNALILSSKNGNVHD